ncbi:hypothetical protein QBC42DRAFT_61176 [Cladorrhinum samala]|uniref:Uncharacterized protein n=1 Tax=Cladorrhinum samala TaxID=585594 RepID=A0AAV9H821_9PEZI|nr:hypothetical protein QBC42DRAFT_61176 [Cladorrhinum samala]
MLINHFLTAIPFLGMQCLANPSPPVFKSRQITDERVHLTDCISQGSQGSVVVYCKNDSVCNRTPAENDICVMRADSLFTWEQRNQGCTFQGTNTRFVWDIEPNARDAEFAEDDVVGSGSNGFHRFNCTKSDNRILFTDNAKRQCKSIYSCFNVSCVN